MENTQDIEVPQYRHPQWQFCHKVAYNGSLNPRLNGQRMTIAIRPTATSNIFVVSHSIVSPKDKFVRKVGRTICMNRIIKHLEMLSTRIDYNCSNEYNIRTPSIRGDNDHQTSAPEDLILTVKQYPYADTVIVSKNVDDREQMNTIAFMFQEGAYLY